MLQVRSWESEELNLSAVEADTEKSNLLFEHGDLLHLTNRTFLVKCFILLVSPLQQQNVEDQAAPMEKKRLVRPKEMQVPPAPLCPRMQVTPSPGSLTTARSLRRVKRRRAVMKR